MISREALKKIMDAGCVMNIQPFKEGNIGILLYKTYPVFKYASGRLTNEVLEYVEDKVISVFVDDMIDKLLKELN